MDRATLEKHRLRKVLEGLRSHRGRHTELISIYVPKGYDINLVAQRVREEYSGVWRHGIVGVMCGVAVSRRAGRISVGGTSVLFV